MGKKGVWVTLDPYKPSSLKKLSPVAAKIRQYGLPLHDACRIYNINPLTVERWVEHGAELASQEHEGPTTGQERWLISVYALVEKAQAEFAEKLHGAIFDGDKISKGDAWRYLESRHTVYKPKTPNAVREDFATNILIQLPPQVPLPAHPALEDGVVDAEVVEVPEEE